MNFLYFQDKVTSYLEKTPENRVLEIGIDAIYSSPLFGVASASDPLFERLKETGVIGEHHLSPKEWLPEASSVISYFLPYSLTIRKANRVPGLPATEWLYGRVEGEEANHSVRRYLIECIQDKGGIAMSPHFDPRYAVVNRRSNYSERHVAFIAGLGTFGLSRSLITRKGCAGRYGSIITDLSLPVTPRPYQEVQEYCNNCGDCIQRCPSGAITAKGKDVSLCASYMDREIRPRYAPRYGCAKCQTNVSCEESLPESSNS